MGELFKHGWVKVHLDGLSDALHEFDRVKADLLTTTELTSGEVLLIFKRPVRED